MHNASESPRSVLSAMKPGAFEGMFRGADAVNILLQQFIQDERHIDPVFTDDEIRALVASGLQSCFVDLMFTMDVGLARGFELWEQIAIIRKTEINSDILRALEFRFHDNIPLELRSFDSNELRYFGQFLANACIEWLKKQGDIEFHYSVLRYDIRTESLSLHKTKDFEILDASTGHERARLWNSEEVSQGVHNIISPADNGIKPTDQ